MTDLLVDLQDIVFLELGRQLELHLVQLDLVAFARGIIAEFEILAPDHLFVFSADRDQVPIAIDPVRMRRVFSNLLLNAVKYSEPQTTIRCQITTTGEGATIAIRDEGAGIPASELESIFERYHRGSNVAANHEGSGIGLAGTRQIIRQHQGDLRVESILGSGSTFRIWLPFNR
jgi:signal transduction histidine kinase